MRRLRRYTTTAERINVIVEQEEDAFVILEKAQHLRMKAFLLELQMYRVTWIVRPNPWRLGKGAIDLPVELGEAGEAPMDVPQMLHKDMTLKQRQSVSMAKDDLDTEGVAVLTFDGGSAK